MTTLTEFLNTLQMFVRRYKSENETFNQGWMFHSMNRDQKISSLRGVELSINRFVKVGATVIAEFVREDDTFVLKPEAAQYANVDIEKLRKASALAEHVFQVKRLEAERDGNPFYQLYHINGGSFEEEIERQQWRLARLEKQCGTEVRELAERLAQTRIDTINRLQTN